MSLQDHCVIIINLGGKEKLFPPVTKTGQLNINNYFDVCRNTKFYWIKTEEEQTTLVFSLVNSFITVFLTVSSGGQRLAELGKRANASTCPSVNDLTPLRLTDHWREHGESRLSVRVEKVDRQEGWRLSSYVRAYWPLNKFYHLKTWCNKKKVINVLRSSDEKG